MVTLDLRQEIADFEADLDDDGRIIFDKIDFKKLPISDENIRTLLKDKTPEIQQKYAPKVARLVKLNQFLASTEGDVGPDDLDNPFKDPHASDADKRAYLITEVMNKWPLKTMRDTREVRYYEEGIYKEGADPLIREETSRLAGFQNNRTFRLETLEGIRDRTGVNRREFDNYPGWIHVKDRWINAETGEFKLNDPELLSLSKLPVKYDKKATCRPIIEFLYNLVQDPKDVPLLLEYLAYCLVCDKDLQKELLLVGPPDCGKSVLLNLFTEFLGGDNVSNVTMQQLSSNRFATAQLYGKKANIYADISHARLEDIERFKAIATADEIEAEKKGMQLFKFKPEAKQIYSANIPPRPPITVDDSYYRRWIIVQCALRERDYFSGKPIKRDPDLLKKLATEENLSGLLNLILISYRRLLKERKFCKTMTTDETRELYDKLSNPVQLWIENNCEVDGDLVLEVDMGYRNYVEFCKTRRITPLKKEWVGRELGQLGYMTEQRGTGKNKKRIWVGLGTCKAPFPSGTLDNMSSTKGKDGLCVPSDGS